MKKIIMISCLALAALSANAQAKFLDNLRKNEDGKGKVVVKQSSEIDALVNGKSAQTTTTDRQHPAQNGSVQSANGASAKQKTNTTQTSPANNAANPQHSTTTTTQNNGQVNHNAQTNQPKESADHNNQPAQDNKNKQQQQPQHNEATQPSTHVTPPATQEEETTVVDTRKKVMRNSYKCKGYRIQIFSGGNSRKDRQKAEQAGSTMKMHFPNEPIYVHFYSPSWKCRMGNYRDISEARRILAIVKSLGYPNACIVKGTISVQY